MKRQERIQEWFTICVITALSLSFVFLSFMSCLEVESEKQRQLVKENPVNAAKERCYSKIRGSRPACWSEADWTVFCERVQCKQQ